MWNELGCQKTEHWSSDLRVRLLNGFFLPEHLVPVGGDDAELDLAGECCSEGAGQEFQQDADVPLILFVPPARVDTQLPIQYCTMRRDIELRGIK